MSEQSYVYLSSVAASIPTKTALGSCDRGQVTYEDEHIYYLVPYRKSSPTPDL